MISQFSLGPLTIHAYGLIIALAILLGWVITKRRASLYKINPALFDDPVLLLPFALAIIGGRLYHVIDKWGFYSQNQNLVFSIANGGLGIFGALLGVFIGFWIFARLKKIIFFSLLDLLSPSLILGQAIGRIGNFINQEGFGPPTNLPWGVYIDPAHRPIQYMFSTRFHPTFFYEAILEVLAFIVLLLLAKKFKKPGQVFSLYLIFYAVSRFTAEFFRTDTAKLEDIKVAYILALLMVIIGFYLLNRSKQLNN